MRVLIVLVWVLSAAPAWAQRPSGVLTVDRIARDYPQALRASCGGWEFMDRVVDVLHASDPRWGYNAKRGDMNDPSTDAIAYHHGAGAHEGSSAVYIFDIIGGHCGTNPQPAWIDQTEATAQAGTIGRYIACRPGRSNCGAYAGETGGGGGGTQQPVDLSAVLAKLDALAAQLGALSLEVAAVKQSAQAAASDEKLMRFEATFQAFRAEFDNYQDRLIVHGLQLGGRAGGFLGLSGTAKLPPRE